MIVKKITASETLGIRHKVMWPTKPMAFVMLPDDENGKHYGLFVNNELIPTKHQNNGYTLFLFSLLVV